MMKNCDVQPLSLLKTHYGISKVSEFSQYLSCAFVACRTLIMPKYADIDYWDKRYKNSSGSPFDWLFEYRHVRSILVGYLKTQSKILIPGCGDAPFSINMYYDGYQNQVNLDLSPVVIAQQKEEFREFDEIEWRCEDASQTSFKDGEFDVICDKSLLDCMVCGKDSAELCHAYIREMYRVLKPGGYFLMFSLHREAAVRRYVVSDDLDWTVSSIRIANPLYDQLDGTEAEEDRPSPCHTFVVCRRFGWELSEEDDLMSPSGVDSGCEEDSGDSLIEREPVDLSHIRSKLAEAKVMFDE